MNLANQMITNYMSQLTNRLQQMNPQMYQLYQTARQQNANPEDMLKQITRNYDENTMKQFKQQAKQFGFSDDLLNQL